MKTYTAQEVIEFTASNEAAFSINEHGEGVPLETAAPLALCELLTELLGPTVACVASPFPELAHLRVIHTVPLLDHRPGTSKLNQAIEQFLGPDFRYGGNFVVASAALAEAAFETR